MSRSQRIDRINGLALGSIEYVGSLALLIYTTIAPSTTVNDYTYLFYIYSDVYRSTISVENNAILILSLISAVISLSLVYGIVKENKFLLIPWLGTRPLILTLLTLVAFIVNLIYSTNVVISALILISLLIISGIYSYCWFSVVRIHLKFNSESDERPTKF